MEWPVTDRLAADGVLLWRLPLPGATRDDLDLVRRGDELAVAAGPTAVSFRCPPRCAAAPSRGPRSATGC
ncbi:hypothetical protein SFUMM280S_04365 [Streptomyces fumanus]